MPAATPSAQEAARADDVAAESGGGDGDCDATVDVAAESGGGDGDCDATVDTAEGHPMASESQHHVDFSAVQTSFVVQSKVVALPPSMRHVMYFASVVPHSARTRSRAQKLLAARRLAPTPRQSVVASRLSMPVVARHEKCWSGSVPLHRGTSTPEPAVTDLACRQRPAASARPAIAPPRGSNSSSVPPPARPSVGLQECA